MLRFHRLYGEKISRRLRQLHIDRLSSNGIVYLLLAIIVERKHLPISELCERAMMRKQQVTQTVNQLEDKSLVACGCATTKTAGWSGWSLPSRP